MKRNLTLAITALFMFVAGISMAQSKKDLLIKTWNYKGVEEFSVVKAPDSTMKSDLLKFEADGTLSMVKNGKNLTGKWSLNEKAAILTITDGKTNKPMNYNLKKLDEKELIIEYQTPDLVRTRYIYEAGGAMKGGEK